MDHTLLEYLCDLVRKDGSHAEILDHGDGPVLRMVVDDWQTEILLANTKVVA